MRFASESRWARDQHATVLACATGIGATVYLMLNSGIDPITQNCLAVVSLLIIALAIACVVLVGAIVFADANREACEAVSLNNLQLELERAVHDSLVDRERLRLVDLMHGPVQGRLAACVMALNFSATAASATTGSSDSVDSTLVDAVLDHLRAVSRDFSFIAGADSTPSP